MSLCHFAHIGKNQSSKTYSLDRMMFQCDEELNTSAEKEVVVQLISCHGDVIFFVVIVEGSYKSQNDLCCMELMLKLDFVSS